MTLSDRLSKAELHDRFVAAIGPAALVAAGTDASGELVVELRSPLPNRVRVYIYNATNPPGGRSTREYKIQLTGQRRGERGDFDWSEVDFVLLCGYAVEHDVFVFWDAALRIDFAYSTNLQVKTPKVEAAAASGERVRQHRRLKTGMEVVICAPSQLAIQAIEERASSGEVKSRSAGPSVTPGQPYMRPPPGGSATPRSRVFRFDPDAIDRGTNAHKKVQNQLADAINARGWEPLSPSDSDPLFDVGWIAADAAWIAEVKSLTSANEERQLRLGLGQVLSYAHLVDWGVDINRPVLAVEREPSSAYWPDLCESHGVALSWPEAFDQLLDSCA
ncbi:MAG: hypothetical protein OXG30_06695 [bacterium]|nr:hypothetical protein [bacterium]MCY4134588.1 hypothetical protein [bacterium]